MRLVVTVEIPEKNEQQFKSMWESSVAPQELLEMAMSVSSGVFEMKGLPRPSCKDY